MTDEAAGLVKVLSELHPAIPAKMLTMPRTKAANRYVRVTWVPPMEKVNVSKLRELMPSDTAMGMPIPRGPPGDQLGLDFQCVSAEKLGPLLRPHSPCPSRETCPSVSPRQL